MEDSKAIALQMIADPNVCYGKCSDCGEWAKSGLMCDCYRASWLELPNHEIAAAGLDGSIIERIKPFGRTFDDMMHAIAAKHGGTYDGQYITVSASN